jgi:hypothetical protein
VEIVKKEGINREETGIRDKALEEVDKKKIQN